MYFIHGPPPVFGILGSLPKYVSVALLSIMAIGFAFGAVQLGPTTKEDQLLPEWHKFQRIINMFNNDFGQGQETPMKMNNLVWGFNKDVPMDRAVSTRILGFQNHAGRG